MEEGDSCEFILSKENRSQSSTRCLVAKKEESPYFFAPVGTDVSRLYAVEF